jgi:hypothetical protein
MLSPTWVFGIPAVIGALCSFALLVAALVHQFMPPAFPAVGNYWAILGAAGLGLSHMSGILAAAGTLYGVRAGYRLPNSLTRGLMRVLSLESMLIAGALLIACGMSVLGIVVWQWHLRHFAATYSVVPALVGTLCLTLGFQNALGGFLLAIVCGNEARFITSCEPGFGAPDDIAAAA